MEDSNYDFRYVRLCDLEIPKENRLNYLQIVETPDQMQHLIWVCIVCQIPF